MILAMFQKFYIGEPIFMLLVCWAAWMTGRAVAKVWQGPPRVVLYALLLAAAARFLHYALYQGPFLNLPYYLADFVLLAAIGLAAFRYTRTNQMVGQYGWLYEKVSPFSWKERAGA